MKEENEHVQKYPMWKKLLKLFSRILLAIFLLFFFLFILVQLPPVQNYLVSKASDFLSEKLETEVKVGSVSLNFFDDFSLNDVLVRDHNRDTLLYSGSVSANFDRPISTLLNQSLYLGEIRLSDAQFNMLRSPDDSLYNLSQIINNLKKNFNSDSKPSSAEKSETNVFNLAVHSLNLNNIHFIQNDSLYGSKIDINLASGFIGIKSLDINEQKFLLDEINLNKGDVEISNFQGSYTGPSKRVPAGEIQAYISTDDLSLSDIDVKIYNHLKEHEEKRGMDYDHLEIDDVNISAEQVSFHNWVSKAKLRDMTLRTNNGFNVKGFQADSIVVSPTLTLLDNILLHTDRSTLNADIKLSYNKFEDFLDYVNSVNMDIRSTQSQVGVKDIMTFAPNLYDNTLFVNNIGNTLKLDGRVQGPVNNLSSQQLYLSLGRSKLNGKVRISGITTEKRYLVLNVSELTTNMKDIQSLLPNSSFSENVINLGQISFQGLYEGSFKDFVAEGSLETSIGGSKFDISMDLTDGVENADYSGSASLSQFDIGKLIDNAEFGVVSLNIDVKEGTGLTASSIKSKFEGEIDSFLYKDYAYQDIFIDGEIEDFRFNGELETSDQNIDVTVFGEVDFTNIEHPSFDIKANVYNADLQALNITDYPMVMRLDFKGDVDSFDIYDFRGSALVTDLNIIKQDSIEMNLDSLELTSSIEDGLNTVNINSELVNGTIQGDYSLFKSINAIKGLLTRSFTGLAERLDLTIDSLDYNTELALNLDINKTSNFQKLISPELDDLRDISIISYVNVATDSLYLKAFAPSIRYGNHAARNAYFYLESKAETGNMILSIDSTIIGGRMRLKPLSVFGDLVSDTMFYTLNLAEFRGENEMNIGGKLYVKEDKIITSISNDNLTIFNNLWKINKKNSILIGDKSLAFKNFLLDSGEKRVSISTEEPNMVDLKVERLQLSDINDILNLDSLKFYGEVDVNAFVDNIYDIGKLNGNLSIDHFQINDEKYGKLDLAFNDNGNVRNTDIDLSVRNDTTGSLLSATGVIHPNNTSSFYDLEANLEKFPLAALEYLLYKNISNTEGDVAGDFTILGAIDKPEINGIAQITDGKTTFDMLGVTYFIKKADVTLTPKKIDFTDQVIYDKYDNSARIKGALLHDRFRDFGMDINVKSDRFLFMDTEQEDNALYYGHVIGEASVDFTGSFVYPNIDIEAKNKDNTIFNLNVASTDDINEIGFVDFMELESTIDTTSDDSDVYSGPQGLNLSIALTATEAGQVNIIMDESGDGNISGRGNGDILLNLNRNGEVSMYGDYNITSGKYTYSYLIVNKPFDVMDGSYVSWTGDPVDAQINIRAKYSTLASPRNLISKYLSEAESETVTTTKVNLFILLQGPLFQPRISFDLELPELTGQQRVLVDNAMSVLEADQSEMDFQALSLLTFGTFNPSLAEGSNFVGNLLGNSITEVLSSYASSYLSSFTNRAVENVNFIDEFNVDLSYDVEFDSEQDVINPDINPNNNNEFQFKLRNSFFNRKVLTEFGFNYIENDLYSSGTFVGGNGSVEYVLSDNRNLRLRGYASQDLVFEGPRLRAGLGLRYKSEFNSFKEYFDGIFSSKGTKESDN